MRAQPRGCGDATVGLLRVTGHHRGEVPLRVIEQRADLGQAEPKTTQRQDAVEPQHVVAVVKPVPAGRLTSRAQQTRLVVVTQGANRDTGQVGKLADPPSVPDSAVCVFHALDRRS